jgi:hypothetical protein
MSLHVRSVRTDIAAFLPATLELAATAPAMAVVPAAPWPVDGRGGERACGSTVASASVPWRSCSRCRVVIVFYAQLHWFPDHRISAELKPQPAPPAAQCARRSAMRWLIRLTGLVSGPGAGGCPGTDAAVARKRCSAPHVLGPRTTERGTAAPCRAPGAEAPLTMTGLVLGWPESWSSNRPSPGLSSAVHRPCHHQRRLPGDRRRHTGDGGGHQRPGRRRRSPLTRDQRDDFHPQVVGFLKRRWRWPRPRLIGMGS